MRKLLIIDPAESFGGAEGYALKVCSAARSEHWTVEAAFNTSKSMSQFGDALTREGTVIHHTEFEMRDANLRSIPAQISMAFKTVVLLRRTRPDVAIVILPWPGNGLGIASALGSLSVPSLVVFQLVPVSKMKFRLPVNWLYRWAHKRKQKWIAVSESNRAVLSESFGICRSEIEVIHNGVDVSILEFTKPTGREGKRQRFLSELKLNNTVKLILSVGRLEERKGFLDVLKAAPQIIREDPQATFVWAGEGYLRPELESRITAAGLSDHFFLLGHRADVPDLLDSCDVFLFPSHFEGFPFSLLEALVHQIPYIASDSCGSTEIGHDGEYGLHFKCGSAREMAEKVLYALSFPEESAQRAAKARARVRDFSIDAMTAKTLRALDSLCP